MLDKNNAQQEMPKQGVPRHHRYYGSSAFNGGERIIERRSGFAPRAAGLRGL